MPIELERTITDDVQSFIWVLLYAMYNNSLASLKASDSEEAYGLLSEEFSKLFSARNVQRLDSLRAPALLRSPATRGGMSWTTTTSYSLSRT